MDCREPHRPDTGPDRHEPDTSRIHLPRLAPDDHDPSEESRQPDWLTRVYGRLKGIADWLYPPTCPLCGDPAPNADSLCAGCRRDLVPPQPACPMCAALVPEAVRCGECQREPRPFARTIAGAWFQPPIDQLVRDMKYRPRLDLVANLADLLGDAVAAHGHPLPEVLVPVPLHVARLRQRGLNPALEIARHLARRFGIPIDRHCAARIRATEPQARLAQTQRRTNVRGAFACGSPLPHGRIAVIDDVMSTGSTAGELAQCLRRAGALEVEVWVLARARAQTRR
jgi:ComF family protein